MKLLQPGLILKNQVMISGKTSPMRFLLYWWQVVVWRKRRHLDSTPKQFKCLKRTTSQRNSPERAEFFLFTLTDVMVLSPHHVTALTDICHHNIGLNIHTNTNTSGRCQRTTRSTCACLSDPEWLTSLTFLSQLWVHPEPPGSGPLRPQWTTCNTTPTWFLFHFSTMYCVAFHCVLPWIQEGGGHHVGRQRMIILRFGVGVCHNVQLDVNSVQVHNTSVIRNTRPDITSVSRARRPGLENSVWTCLWIIKVHIYDQALMRVWLKPHSAI